MLSGQPGEEPCACNAEVALQYIRRDFKNFRCFIDAQAAKRGTAEQLIVYEPIAKISPVFRVAFHVPDFCRNWRKEGKRLAVPRSEHYRDPLARAEFQLCGAAELTANYSLGNFLMNHSEGSQFNQNTESDIAPVRMDASIEAVIVCVWHSPNYFGPRRN